MTREEFALKLGISILDNYDIFYEKAKTSESVGKYLICSVQMPIEVGSPEWSLDIQTNMPWFFEVYYENGERKHKHVSMDEYYGWKK